MSFIQELKRRNVVKVGVAYVVASWLLLQMTDVLVELLELQADVGKIVILLLIVGFVPALIFAWAFEMTPEGIKREQEVDRSRSVAAKTGRKLDYTIIGMLVVVAAYFIWESRFSGKVSESTEIVQSADTGKTPGRETTAQNVIKAPIDKRVSIVVLPFVNMSADPNQEFFSDGLSEEILNALAQVKDLRVISRTSAFAFKGKELSIPEIAAQLGVSHVLEGSVRTANDSVRITAQLIKVDSDSHLWSDAYSRDLENVFEIQEEISVAIAKALQLTLNTSGLPSRPTASTAAYEAYLRGRHLYQQRSELARASELLQQAVALDADFSEAWANLAASQMVQAYGSEIGHRELMAQSRVAAKTAIQIDSHNGFAHAVLGLHQFSELDYDAAVDSIKHAIALNPNESNSYLWMGIVLSSLGYVQEALFYLKQAETIDPVFSNLQNWLISMYLITGEYELASKHRDKFDELSTGVSINLRSSIELAAGLLDEAERLEIAEYSGNEAARQLFQAYYAALRDPDLTAEFVRLSEELDPSLDMGGGKLLVWDSSLLLYRLGEIEKSLEWKRQERLSGRGLRFANDLGFLWLDYDRKYRNHPAVLAFYEETGMADYWRKHGNPDYCRVDGSKIECRE